MRNIILTLLFLSFFIITAFPKTNFSSELVAYYPFNGNANDESGNGNNGVVDGATLTTDRFGNINKAYSFNDGKIVANDRSLPMGNSDRTISMWVNTSEIQGLFPNSNPAHLIKYGPETNSNNLCLAMWGDVLRFSGYSFPPNNDLSYNHPVNQWFNLTVTLSNQNQVHIYKDAELIYTGANEVFNTTSNGALVIGEFMKAGKIDDIRIFNRALSKDEITQLYNSEKPDMDLTNGLVAYYPFNGNAKDESGNGNDGVVYGTTLSTDRFGNVGKAYDFDGVDDYISISNSPKLNNITEQYTYSIWFNVNNWYESGGNHVVLLCKHDGILTNIYLHIFGGDSEGNNSNILTSNSIIGNIKIELHKWFHLAVTSDGKQTKYFLNGTILGVGQQNGSSQSNSSALEIGRNLPGQVEFFNGSIDDIRIYNRTLTDVEIKSLFENYPDKLKVINLKAVKNSLIINEEVAFTNLSSGFSNNAKYFWSFGDGTTSKEISPVHAYNSIGKYDVKLTIVDEQKKYVKSMKEYIKVGVHSLCGKVVDKNTGVGLDKVVVFMFIDGKPIKATKTNIEGSFEFILNQSDNIKLEFRKAGYVTMKTPEDGCYSFTESNSQQVVDIAMFKSSVTDYQISNLVSYQDNIAHVMEKGTAIFYFFVKDKTNNTPVTNSKALVSFSNLTQQKDVPFLIDNGGLLKVRMNSDTLGFKPTYLKITSIDGVSITYQPTVNISVDPIWGYEKQWQVKKKLDVGANVIVASVDANIGSESKIILSKLNGATTDPDLIGFPSKFDLGISGSAGPKDIGAGIRVSGSNWNLEGGLRGSLSATLGEGLSLNTLHEYPYSETNNVASNIEQTILGFDFLGNFGVPMQTYLPLIQYLKSLNSENVYPSHFIESGLALTLNYGASGSFFAGISGGSDNLFVGEAVKASGDVNVSMDLFMKNYNIENCFSYGIKVSGDASTDFHFANIASMGFKGSGTFENSFEIVKDANSVTKAIKIKYGMFCDPLKTYGIALNPLNAKEPIKHELYFVISGPSNQLDLALELMKAKPFGYIADNLMNVCRKDMPNTKESSGFMAVDRNGFSSFLNELMSILLSNSSLKVDYGVDTYDRINSLFSLEGSFNEYIDFGGEYTLEVSNKHISQRGVVINGQLKPLELYSPSMYQYFDNPLGQTMFRSVNSLYEQYKTSFIKSVITITNDLNAASDAVGSAVVKLTSDAVNVGEKIVTDYWSWAANANQSSLSSVTLRSMEEFKNEIQNKLQLKLGIGGFYTLSPYKQTVGEGSTLKIYYKDSEIEDVDEHNLAIYKWIKDQNKWFFHGGIVNVDSNYVLANIDTLYTYAVGPCIPNSKIVLHPSQKSVLADSCSVVDFVSDTIYLNNDTMVSNQYLFSVSSTNGTLLDSDVDLSKDGLQIHPSNGVLKFKIKASSMGDSVLVRIESVQGLVKGDTTIVFIDNSTPAIPTGLTLVRVSSGLLLKWNKNPEIDVAGYQAYVDTTGNQDFRMFDIGCANEFLIPEIFVDSVSVRMKAFDYSNNFSGYSDPVYINEDLTSPTILEYTPIDEVDSCTNVSIYFDKPINQNTVNDSTFFVYSNRKDGMVSGKYSFNDNTNNFTFTPDSSLIENDTIFVTATDGIKDVSGNSLSQLVFWSFIVGEKTPNSSLKGVNNEQHIKLFPTQSTGVINFEIEGDEFLNKHIEVVDMNGCVVYTFELKGLQTCQINLSSFPKGIYLVRMFENKCINIGKIILI